MVSGKIEDFFLLPLLPMLNAVQWPFLKQHILFLGKEVCQEHQKNYVKIFHILVDKTTEIQEDWSLAGLCQ